MKKTMLTSAFLLAIGFTTAWAADGSHIPAENSGNSVSGNLISSPSIGRHNVNILSSQLPPALLTGIKQDYKNYWISGLYEEVQNKHSTYYYITIENADQIIKLSATDSENWVVTDTVLKAI